MSGDESDSSSYTSGDSSSHSPESEPSSSIATSDSSSSSIATSDSSSPHSSSTSTSSSISTDGTTQSTSDGAKKDLLPFGGWIESGKAKTKLYLEDESTPQVIRTAYDKYKHRKYKRSLNRPCHKKRAPAWICCRFIAKCPMISLAVLLCLMTVVSYLAAGAYFTGLFELNSEGFFEDRSHRFHDRWFSLQEARLESEGTDPSQTQQSLPVYDLTILFRSKGSGSTIFTEEILTKMRELEQSIINDDEYYDICYMGPSYGECEPPLSVLNYFYPTIEGSGANATYIYDGRGDTLQDINATLARMATFAGDFSEAAFYVDEDFSSTNLVSRLTRIDFVYGLPIAGFDNSNERRSKQLNKLEDFNLEFYDALVTDSYPGFDAYSAGRGLIGQELTEFLYQDFALAIVSLIVVFLLIWFQTHSLFIAICSAIQISMAYPPAILTYRFLFNIELFSGLNIMIIFLMLGIGADDIFVFWDTYRESEVAGPHVNYCFAARLTWVFKRAGWAMFVTTMTTFASFLVVAYSPIIDISTFGVWSALVVLWNYILVITLFPVVVTIHYKYLAFKPMVYCVPICCIPGLNKISERWKKQKMYLRETYLNWEYPSKHYVTARRRIYDQIMRTVYAPLITNQGVFKTKRKNRVENILCLPCKIVPLKFYFFFIATLGIIILAAFAVQTKPETEQPDWLPDDSNYAGFEDYVNDFRETTLRGGGQQVVVVYGISGLDGSGDPINLNDQGNPEYRKSFQLETLEQQQSIRDMCDTIEADREKLELQDDRPGCFIRDFDAWLQSTYNLSSVEGDEFLSYLLEFRDGDGYRDYYGSIGFIYSDEGVDPELRFVTLEYNSSLDLLSTSFIDGFKNVDDIEDVVDDGLEGAAEGVNKAWPTMFIWTWWHLQELLVQLAFQGMGISLAVAFFMMVVMTQNILLAIYSTASIMAIVTCMLGAIRLLGWDFGIVESISAIMAVGLSVDYTVHLAHAYSECKRPSSSERTRYAIGRIGVSILSGSITTAGAVLVLQLGQVVYMVKYGTIILIIVIYSLFVAMFGFTAVLAIAGPQNDFMNLRPFLSYIFRRIKRLILPIHHALWPKLKALVERTGLAECWRAIKRLWYALDRSCGKLKHKTRFWSTRKDGTYLMPEDDYDYSGVNDVDDGEKKKSSPRTNNNRYYKHSNHSSKHSPQVDDQRPIQEGGWAYRMLTSLSSLPMMSAVAPPEGSGDDVEGQHSPPNDDDESVANNEEDDAEYEDGSQAMEGEEDDDPTLAYEDRILYLILAFFWPFATPLRKVMRNFGIVVPDLPGPFSHFLPDPTYSPTKGERSFNPSSEEMESTESESDEDMQMQEL